jgi:hypothetical protein
MDWLKSIAPVAASLLAGPAAGMAVKFLADQLGTPSPTLDAVSIALTNLNGTPEGRLQLAQLDAALKTHAINAGLDLERLAVANASDVNKSMQAESAAEHWPTYSWRPFIGFVFGVNLLIAGVTTSAVYIAVMCGVVSAVQALGSLPAMIGALGAVNGAALPILGIASWFRGKAQADPSISTVNRG